MTNNNNGFTLIEIIIAMAIFAIIATITTLTLHNTINTEYRINKKTKILLQLEKAFFSIGNKIEAIDNKNSIQLSTNHKDIKFFIIFHKAIGSTVRYYLEKNNLIEELTINNKKTDRILITNINNLNIELIKLKAIKFTLSIKKIGTIYRVFYLPNNYINIQ